MSDPLSPEPRRPRAVRLEPKPLPGFDEMPAPPRAPRAAPPPVELLPDPFLTEPLTLDETEQAVETAQRRGILRRGFPSWGGLFWSALGGLVSLGVGLWVTSLVDDAFRRAPALGWIGVGLAALAGLAMVMLGWREVAAIGRQRHIARLHADLAHAHAADDGKASRRLLADLVSIYAARPETAQARAEIAALYGEIVDGRDLIEIAERSLVAPLDARAAAAIAGAAKRVSAVTTLAPRAIVDVIFVALQAVRLIRRISEIYGGRPGLVGFLALLRSVGTHLAITGGMAAGDTILQQLVGHGIAAKVSARLGEGMLNGLLTARIGLSAMAVCRPMPFHAEKVPSVRCVVPFLFRGEDKG